MAAKKKLKIKRFSAAERVQARVEFAVYICKSLQNFKSKDVPGIKLKKAEIISVFSGVIEDIIL